ncbi:EAL domain-containing protein [Alteromonas sp. W364]|uniref:bifunctional diguanylate cyclase/phosphodiesterase n=1 Tax=Alteromonas sp. W364 TaxID=3075610 RepID=UPI00288759DE|nr:EAL domain-containing protein [Alteromonas sp. W364]MDT0628089.1 EAL domain-containing protein [Alteromonas sp. W364]
MSEDEKVIGELSEQELRELIPQLQLLTEKYKRAEQVQKALFEISELASSVSNLDRLYKAVHDIVSEFMSADNFYVAFYDPSDKHVDFAYFVDEVDEEELSRVPYERIMDGVTGYILKSGTSLVLTKENLESVVEETGIEILGTPPVDLVGVPLKRSTEVIGAMVVQSYNDDVRYDQDDFEVLSFISQHIVTTVDRVKSREVTERTIRERTKQLRTINDDLQEEILERQKIESLQTALFEISELSVALDDDMPRFYSKLHAILARLISAPNCFVAVLTENKDSLNFPYFSDELHESADERPLGLGLTEYIIRRGEASLIDNSRILALVEEGEVDVTIAQNMMEHNNSWLGSPLVIDGEVHGVIAVQTYGKLEDYTQKDLEILRFVSHHIAVAMERRRSSESLKEYNLQLTEKVQERTEELNKTNEYLKKQIEQRKEIELKLIHDAHHDALTDLPNRVMFNSRLELAIANKKRHPENQFAVLFIDLDRFKIINDTLGHHAGDEFLVEVAQRIALCKRGHDLLARLGGDEFVILLDNFETVSAVEEVATRVINSVSVPFVLDGKEMFSGASIGIAHLNSTYMSADEVLRDADAAMYQAKSLGRGRYITFDKSMREKLLEDIQLEAEFRKALKAKSFDCVLQPVMSLTDETLLYYECTLQWHNETFGQINREQFWQIAEQCGMTLDLNQFLLDGAIGLLAQWKHDPQYANQRIGVSLSVEHLMQKDLVNELIEQVKEADFEPDMLLLEFSESALTNRSQFILPAIKKIKRNGFGLILDNFGSGSASLNYLFSYPFKFLKIDERFVQSFTRSEKNLRFIESVILVAEKVGLTVIAEGISSKAKLDGLIGLGCEFGQGDMLGQTILLDFVDDTDDAATEE